MAGQLEDSAEPHGEADATVEMAEGEGEEDAARADEVEALEEEEALTYEGREAEDEEYDDGLGEEYEGMPGEEMVELDGIEGLAVVEEEGEVEEEEEALGQAVGDCISPAFRSGKGLRGSGSAERCERRLRRERAALVGELGHAKAKFALTLQTLRAILRLGENATWADIVEHCEALANFAAADFAKSPGNAPSAAWLPTEAQDELHEVEMECEQLQQKLEEREQHIARLRELLQKQQSLLDMTAQQFEGQHAQIAQQADAVSALEARCQAQQATIRARERQVSSLEAELGQHRQLGAQQDDLLQTQATRLTELEAQLSEREETLAVRIEELDQLRGECDHWHQQAEESNEICERQYLEIKELEEALTQQGDLVERMTDQLQVHEAAERRRYSYQTASASAESLPAGSLQLEHCASVGNDLASADHCSSVGSSRPSARRSPRRTSSGQPQPLQRRAGAPPPASEARGVRRMPLGSAMTEEERVRFLSHFPMASRTERHFRNRLEDRRKARPGAPPEAPLGAAPLETTP